jgi:hypothetical protein
MERSMLSDPFALWTGYIVLAGLFIIFLFEFGDFVVRRIWRIVEPLLTKRPEP